MTPQQRDRYGQLIQASNALAAARILQGTTADGAARVIAKAVTTRNPRTRYTWPGRGPDHPTVTGTAGPDARPRLGGHPPSALPEDNRRIRPAMINGTGGEHLSADLTASCRRS